jgi:YD repeat-containing protein
LCAWHDAGADTINIQVNNGSVDSTAWTLGVYDGNAPFNIGRIGGDSPSYHDGAIDEVVLYKRVLTLDERTWLYNGGGGRTTTPITTTLTYDQAGRKKTMSDPDMGNWTYGYDALAGCRRDGGETGKLGE